MMDEVRKQLLQAMGFSLKAIDVLEKKLNHGLMENPTVQAQHQGTCGDILMLALQIDNGLIENAMYEYIGCAGLQACASAMTEIIKGKSLTEAEQITVSDIISYLERIPQKKYECAEIARDTLIQAIRNYHPET